MGAENLRQLVNVVDDRSGDGGRAQLGDVNELARLLQGREYGDYEINRVWAVDRGDLRAVNHKISMGDFDESSYAVLAVTVTFPDGSQESGHHVIDGAA